MTRADGNTLAAPGAPPREHRGAALRLHTAAKAVRFRTAAAVRLKCALRHGKSGSRNFFGLGRPARCFNSLPDSGAQPLSHRPRDSRELASSRQDLSISHRFTSRKNRDERTFFTTTCATFARRKFFSSQLASLRLLLCYYRQRSLKIFSTPCGSRKNLTEASMRDRSEPLPASTDLIPNSP